MQAEVVTVTRDKAGRGHFGNVQHCHSVWECWDCAPRIRRERAAELKAVIAKHGGPQKCVLVTLTVAHKRGDSLRKLQRGLQSAWRRMKQWRSHGRLLQRFGVIGYVKALEVQYGGFAGWHPHLHAVVFVDHPLTDEETVELERGMFVDWSAAVVRELGEEHAPSEERGVDVRALHRTDYLTKMNARSPEAELTNFARAKRSAKGHLSPWDIAERAAQEHEGYARLWREYCDAMFGAKMLTWSEGLRERFGLDAEPEDAPEELPECEEGELVAEIPLPVWGQIQWARLDDGRMVRIAILEAVDGGGDDIDVRMLIEQYRRERAARSCGSWR